MTNVLSQKINSALQKLLIWSGATEDRITHEMLDIQYQQFVTNVIGTSTVAALFMFFIEGATEMFTAWLWAGAQWLLNIALFTYRWSFLKAAPNQRNYNAAYRNALIIMIISGLLWGLTPYAFLEATPAQYPLILTATIALILSGGLALIYLPMGYMVFSFISMPPVAFVMFYIMDHWSLLGAMIIFYMAMTVQFTLNSNRSAASSIGLRFNNEDIAQQLHLANIAKSRFLATASHDLRQPLQALTLLNASALENGRADKTLLQSMQRNINSLNVLFEALLDISKLDAGVVKLEKEAVSVADLVTTLVNNFQQPAEAKNLQLICSNQIQDLYINSDLSACHRILLNLVSNAIRYTESGSININVETLTKNNKELVKISVKDTGVGIAAENLKSIFGEFYQANESLSNQSGLGLGLSIVDRLTTLLGHSIEVKSTVNKGSCFSLLAERIQAPTPENLQTEPKLQKIQEGKSILLVDDDNEIINAMKILLEKWGYKTLLANNADEVQQLDIKELNEIDALISDYNLGSGPNGLELIQWLKQHITSDIPCILITGTTTSEFMKESSSINQSHILHKPIMPAKLRLLLESVFK